MCVGCGDFAFFRKNTPIGCVDLVCGCGYFDFFEKLFLVVWVLCVGCGNFKFFQEKIFLGLENDEFSP